QLSSNRWHLALAKPGQIGGLHPPRRKLSSERPITKRPNIFGRGKYGRSSKTKLFSENDQTAQQNSPHQPIELASLVLECRVSSGGGDRPRRLWCAHRAEHRRHPHDVVDHTDRAVRR